MSRLSAVALPLLLLVACDPAPPPTGCRGDTECETGERCVDGRCAPGIDGGGMDAGGGGGTDGGPDGGPPAMVTSIAVVPAAPTITCANGAATSLDLEAEAVYDDGTRVAITNAFWSIASTGLATIAPTTGEVTANGNAAGTVEVTVEALGRSATATVTISVTHTVLGDGAPSDAADRFTGTPVTDAAREANLLYPNEGTVFPQNVYPADVQWERGVTGDLHRVSLSTTGVTVDAYVAEDGNHHWPVTAAAWRALAESAPEAPVTIRVDRWEASSSEVVTGTPRTVRFADAAIRGAIYYWDLGGGRILRIRGDGTGRESFMPDPPARPSDGRRCVACHTVSRDGTRMAAELWDGGDYGAVFDLTVDLSGDPAPTLVPPTQQRWLTASFSPDNARLIANFGTELFLVDGATGARLTPAGTALPTTGAAHPTWSPDGTQIAYVANHNGSWGVDFTAGDLAVLGVTAADTFGPSATIATGGDRTVARPSWSPDSAWIAYQHSEHSRAYEDPGDAPSILREGSIRMVSRDGATSFDLETLNAGVDHSYYPTFSPFDEGGYYWLGFFSTRDYGNAQVGTRGTSRRQLWVAAVSSSPSAGTDPSHAAYWLPQQDVTHENMAAFWAEEPCRAEGRSCAASAECCSGFCRDTGGGPICVPPDTVECSERGESCADDGDCCEGAGSCLANVCTDLG